MDYLISRGPFFKGGSNKYFSLCYKAARGHHKGRTLFKKGVLKSLVLWTIKKVFKAIILTLFKG